MGLCLWGSSLPGEPSCWDREKRTSTKISPRAWKTHFIFWYTNLWQILCFLKFLVMPFIILTEGERDSGGVNWRASRCWVPDQSREGDVLRCSALVSTAAPPPESSRSTLTPTPAMLTSPLERRWSAGGLGSTILLKDKRNTQYWLSCGCGEVCALDNFTVLGLGVNFLNVNRRNMEACFCHWIFFYCYL